MKRFLLVAMILVSAASAYAAELKITGDAEVRGIINNAELDGNKAYKDKYFDADFNFNCALVVTENTTVFTKLTFDAENFQGTGFVPDSEAADAVTMLGVERAYISTKFLPALTVDAGLMSGGVWGTAFGNTEINVTRIKGTYAIDENISVMAIYEKYAESNQDTLVAAVWNKVYANAIAGGASEAAATAAANGVVAGLEASETTDYGDTTSYYLAAKIKAGAFTILPLFKYQNMETAAYVAKTLGVTTDVKKPYAMTFDIAATGDLGTVGFEAEFIYTSVNWDDIAAENETKYGAYVDVFAKLDVAKAGLAAFYCSADDKKGSFSAGEDFDFLLVTEDMFLENITAMMAGKLYASDIKIVDKITADVAAAYGMSTNKDVADTYAGTEVTFWEVDAGVNYAIDAATTYTIEGGYASFDNKEKMPIDAYQVMQKIAVKF